jgi:tRNA-Thr(GGU) m(6)t(6)A37 methyltransferase TsaA
MEKIIYEPIGFIYSPFKKPQGTPVQSSAAQGVQGLVEIKKKYLEGLDDLEGFSHIMLLYHFHLSGEPVLSVKPFLDENFHGLFATRASARPNPIGLSVVRLKKISGSSLHVLDIDIVDRTPLLDVKPYIPQFDERTDCRIGWLRNNIGKMNAVADDGRFLNAQSDEPDKA